MFELYQAAGRYAKQCLRRVFRLVPVIFCLALALVFFNAVGAMAQDTTPSNVRPVADAGEDREVASGSSVTLDGSDSSDRDGTVESWTWTRTGGTGGSVTLSDASVAQPTFMADTLPPGEADVTHEFTLIVTDDEGLVAVADTVTVTVTAPFAAPVAVVGSPNRTVASGAELILDGSGSTADRRRTIVAWEWEYFGGAVTRDDEGEPIVDKPRVTIGNINAFSQGRIGELLAPFILTVTDSAGVKSEPVEVRVTVTQGPVADKNPPEILSWPGLPETHDGKTPFDMGVIFSEPVTGFTASDIEFYFNVLFDGLGGARQLATDLQKTAYDDRRWTFTVTPDEKGGYYQFGLRADSVKDAADKGNNFGGERINYANPPPVADAGAYQLVRAGSMVRLDGRGTVDRNGERDNRGNLILHERDPFDWDRTGGTDGRDGRVVALTDAHTSRPSFRADSLSPGDPDVTHIFTLTVTDAEGAISTDTVTVTVTAGNLAAPIADAGSDQTVDSGATVQLRGGGSDSGGTVESYAWSRTGGTGDSRLMLTNANRATASFTADTLVPGAKDVTHIFELIVTDNDGAPSDPDSVEVTVTSPFAAPVADAGPNQTVGPGSTVTLDGSGSMAERRRTIESREWTRTGGTGAAVTLSDPTAAMPTFTADTPADGVEDVTHIFELIVTDDLGRKSVADTVTITVTAPFAGPVAEAGPEQTVGSGTVVTLDGSGSKAERRRAIASFAWERTDGTGGPVTLSSTTRAQPTFTADVLTPGAEDVTHVFSLVVTDDFGAVSVADTVTVTVNAPPVANAGSDQMAASGGTVTLDGSASNDSNGIATYAWERTAGTSTADVTLRSGNTAMPTFTADALAGGAEDVTHVFTLTVRDQQGLFSTDTVTITVTASFANPVADAGPNQTVAPGATVTLDGSASTVDRRRSIASYAWARTGGNGGTVMLSSESVAKPTFTADALTPGAADVTHVFTLTVTDDAGGSHDDTVTVTVTTGNLPPIADAGDDQTVVGNGANFNLNGNGSDDRDGTITRYDWTRIRPGETAEKFFHRGRTPGLTTGSEKIPPGDPDRLMRIFLVVTDNQSAISEKDEVRVTFTAPFATPVAEAGPGQTVGAGASVRLYGGGSTVDRRRTIASYGWSRTGGTGGSVSLNDPTAEQPTFTADTPTPGAADATHVFTLTVTDSAAATDTDTVTITVIAPFAAPVANAGLDKSVGSGAVIRLDGSGSTKDRRRSLDYAWTRTGGTAGASVALNSANTAMPTFKAEAPPPGAANVTHTFTLRVTDSAGDTTTDMVTITVTPNAIPVANAGDDLTVAAGATVTLVGSGRDVGGRVVSYAWRWVGGTGAAVTLTGAQTSMASFTADTPKAGAADVIHEFELIVTDNEGAASDPDQVTVTVTAPFADPVAEAGEDLIVASGKVVMLDGSGSTAERRRTIASYAWTRTGGTTGGSVTLDDASAERPIFTADTLSPGAPDVIHILQLIVEDDAGIASEADTVTVTVEAPNLPPVADAGDDQTVAPGATVILDARGSMDNDGTVVTYFWSQIVTGSGSVSLTDAHTSMASFTADTLAHDAADVTHEFILFVTDDGGTRTSDRMRVTVSTRLAPPDTVAPRVRFGVVPDTHDGVTPFPLEVVFTEDVKDFIASDINERLEVHANYAFDQYSPLISNFLKDPANDLRYTFTVTPRAPIGLSIDLFGGDYTDFSDNPGGNDIFSGNIRYRDPNNVAPVAVAGPDRVVVSGETVTLDGSGSTDSGGTIASWYWERTGGTGGPVTLSNPRVVNPSFTADTLSPDDDDVTHVFSLVVTDNGGETSVVADTVMVTVVAENQPPVAEAGKDLTVASGATVILDGSGSTDPVGRIIRHTWYLVTKDCADTNFLTGSGTFLPVPNTGDVQVTFVAETLMPDEPDKTYCFELAVTDDRNLTRTDTVMVTVTAGDLPPVADAGPDLTVASGARVDLDGSGTSANDGVISSYIWSQRDDDPAHLKVVIEEDQMDSSATFTAPVLEPGGSDVTINLNLFVYYDSRTKFVVDTITVTVIAPNALPVVSAGDDRMVAPGATVILDGSGTDLDGTVKSYAWTRTGGTTGASVFIENADMARAGFTAGFPAPGTPDVTHEFTLAVTDYEGGVGTDTVTVTVESPNAPPVADGGLDQVVASGATVFLNGSFSSDRGGRIETYSWDRTGGTGGPVRLSSASAEMPTFIADTLAIGAAEVTHEFALTVTDDEGATSTDFVTVTVTAGPVNKPPEVDAGPDQTVTSGKTVFLDGRRSADRDGRIVRYLWQQRANGASTVNLIGAHTSRPRFTAATVATGAANVTYEFILFVTDDGGVRASDIVRVTVTPPDTTPPSGNFESGWPTSHDGMTPFDMAVVFTESVFGFTAADVTLDPIDIGSNDILAVTPLISNFKQDPVNDLRWTFTLTPIANFEFTVTIPSRSFADEVGTVNSVGIDNGVTISYVNPPPVADAGPDLFVASGAMVTLDGSASTDSNGRVTGWTWRRSDGTGGAVTLSDAGAEQPTFTADTLTPDDDDVTHIFELFVIDDESAQSATDTVTVTVSAGNLPPIADAGPDRMVRSDESYTLDATGSRDRENDGTITRYQWWRTSGITGRTTALSTTSATPGFRADMLEPGGDDVTHVYQLIVTDNDRAQSSDEVRVTILAPNVRPVANAGPDQEVASGASVTLDGRGSTDDDGTVESYTWERISGTGSAVTLSDSSAEQPTFTADTLVPGAADVTHVFTLTVTDNEGQAAAVDTVIVTVTALFAATVAEAGPNQSVAPGAKVILNGGGSIVDYRRTIRSWAWERISGTGGLVTLSDASAERSAFTADRLAPGVADVTHVFTLTVTDSAGATSSDTVTVTVRPPEKDKTSPSFAFVGIPASHDGTTPFDVAIVFTEPVTDVEVEDIAFFAEASSKPVVTNVVADPFNARRYTFTVTFPNPPHHRIEIFGGIPHPSTDSDGRVYDGVMDLSGNSNKDLVFPGIRYMNVPPVADAGPDRYLIVSSGEHVELEGIGTDRNGTVPTNGYAWTRAGGTDGKPVNLFGANSDLLRFTANTLAAGDPDVTHVFELVVTDDEGTKSAPATVTVTVTAGNVPPIANAGPDRTVVSGTSISLDGSGSMDRDGTITSYAWARTGGTEGVSVTLSDPNVVNPTFSVFRLAAGDPDVTHVFELIVTDDKGFESVADTVTITVAAPYKNDPPVARAGVDETVVSGGSVTFDGTGSYDGTFDSTGFKPDGMIVSFNWQPYLSSPEHALLDHETANPTFTGDTLEPGADSISHIFSLQVTDDDGARSDHDFVMVTVESPNADPVAVADANQRVATGATVTLDGSESTDIDGTIVTYAWRWTDGPQQVALTNANTDMDDLNHGIASFTAPLVAAGAADVTHTFELTVTDDEGGTDTLKVKVVVTAAPVANAGPDQMVKGGDTVTLDGSGSMVSAGRIRSWAWTRMGGTGAAVMLSDMTAQPTFTAPTPEDTDTWTTQTLIFSLVVTDNRGVASELDLVTVTVTADRPSVIFEEDTVPDKHDGMTPFDMAAVFSEEVRGFDSNSDVSVSYTMTGTHSGENCLPLVSDLRQDPNNPFRYTFTITPRCPTDIGVAIYGENFRDLKDIRGRGVDTGSIRYIDPGNDAPVADAGPDQRVGPGASFTLDSKRSTDGDGTITLWRWTRPSGTGNPRILDHPDRNPNYAPVVRRFESAITLTADDLPPGGADVTHVFELSVRDNDFEWSEPDTVMVTVTTGNLPPVANAGPDKWFRSGKTVTLDGSGSTDDQNNIKSYAWTRTGGTGDSSVTLRAENTVRPTFTADTVAPGADDVTHDFELVVTDNEDVSSLLADTVTVTIRPPNRRPVANAGPPQTVDSGGRGQLDGSGSIDHDGTIRTYSWVPVGSGPHPTLSSGSVASPTFTAPTLETGAPHRNLLLGLIVNDDEGAASLIDFVTLTVRSPNAPPVAVANGGATELLVPSGATVFLDASDSSDSDGRVVSWLWYREGGDAPLVAPGLTDANMERASFTANTLAAGAKDVQQNFTLTVTDDRGGTNTTKVAVVITAKPVANAGPDQTVVARDTVTLDGRGSMGGAGTIASYAWTRMGGTGAAVTLSDMTAKQPTFTAPQPPAGAASATHIFQLIVTDDANAVSVADTVTVTVNANALPVARGGPDLLVPSGAAVTLDGSASSDRDGGSISHEWTFESGPVGSVRLTDANTAEASFTAPAVSAGGLDIVLIFLLTVTDDRDGVDTDRVRVTITAKPIANAGPDQTVIEGDMVTLDGSGSLYSAGRPIDSWAWTRTGGTGDANVMLSDATAAMPTFIAPRLAAGTGSATHNFQLIVMDDANVASVADTVMVTVIPNAKPVAVVGSNQVVHTGATVTLDGRGSMDDDGDIVSYAWEWKEGTTSVPVTLAGANTAVATFTADTVAPGAADVRHGFTLTVTDDKGDTGRAKVGVTIQPPNLPPVADAGPDRIVASGARVDLDGSGSTDDDGTFTWSWAQAPADTSSVTLAGQTTARPYFTAATLEPGVDDVTYRIILTLTDDDDATTSDEVTVTVTAPLADTLANAGPDQPTVASGATVTLDGSGSTADRRKSITSHAWARTGGSGDSNVALDDPNATQPIFTADSLAPGAPDVTHEFTLTVTDDVGGTDTDTVVVTVNAPFAETVANAGDDQTVRTGATVTLNGSGTIVDRRRTVTRAWTRTGGTGDSSVMLSDTSAEQPTFTADTVAAGVDPVTHEFMLTVMDDAGGSSTDTVMVTVAATNLQPVADAGDDFSVASGEAYTLDATRSMDPDGTIGSTAYTWTLANGIDRTVTTLGANTATPGFTAETRDPGAPDVTHRYTLVVTDNEMLASRRDSVFVTITSPFADPVAHAGDDLRVRPAVTVTLDGTESTHDLRRTPLTYAWTRTGGTGDATVAALDDPSAKRPNFTSDALTRGAPDVTHEFMLTVTDKAGGTDTDTVTVTVESLNADPVAHAGDDQRVPPAVTVTLDGRRSMDIDGTVASYVWERMGGSGDNGVMLDDPTAQQPTFTAEARTTGAPDVTHEFKLTVTDDQGATDTDTVTITVTTMNIPPVADAGDDFSVDSGEPYSLDGTGSRDADPSDFITVYEWSEISEGVATVLDITKVLKDGTTATPTLKPETLEPGAPDVTLVYQLVVEDFFEVPSAPDTVNVTVTAPFAETVANAGDDQTVLTGAPVALDGSGSTHDRRRTIETYEWARTDGTSTATLALTGEDTAQLSFTADTLTDGAEDVTHVFELTVTDDQGGSSTDMVEVKVQSRNKAPVANAGPDKTVASGAPVTLDGSGSDDIDGILLRIYGPRTWVMPVP